MTVLEKIAHFQERRDEVPNQELARELADAGNVEGIREIAENLWNKDPDIQADCIKVLYETAYLRPELIAPYIDDFLKMIHSRNNRLVWGAMIALGTIAHLRPAEIFAHFEEIKKIMASGSVITIDNGVKALAMAAAAGPEARQAIFPYLLEHLSTCRPKEIPQHAEKTLPAVDAGNRDAFIAALERRLEYLSEAQAARVKKVIKQAKALQPAAALPKN